ncbi:unnamed protein product [Albugo candida]|uniref:Uncharacterized protein n=1 Tax=Albugo candida TaxID=65357 RepID=A0A024FVF9_9STRA|nr:unnamed protein product [Albugo candida]|eukprot:CCI10649.1 unnamed protein product [Albugo candida]
MANTIHLAIIAAILLLATVSRAMQAGSQTAAAEAERSLSRIHSLSLSVPTGPVAEPGLIPIHTDEDNHDVLVSDLLSIDVRQPHNAVPKIEYLSKEVYHNPASGSYTLRIVEEKVIGIMKENYRLDQLKVARLVNCLRHFGTVSHNVLEEQAIHSLRNLPPGVPDSIPSAIVNIVKPNGENYNRAREAEVIYILKSCPSGTSEEAIQHSLNNVRNDGVITPSVQDAAAICRLRSLPRAADDSKIEKILEKVRDNGVVSRSVLEQEAIYRLNNLPSSTPVSTIMDIFTNKYHDVQVHEDYGEQAIYFIQKLPPHIPVWMLKKLMTLVNCEANEEYCKKAREVEVIYILKNCSSGTSEEAIQHSLNNVRNDGVISPSVQDAAAICRLRSLPRAADDSKIEKILEKVRDNGVVSRSVLEQEAIYRLNNLPSSAPVSTIINILTSVEKRDFKFDRNREEKAIRAIQILPPHIPVWMLEKIMALVNCEANDEYYKRAREAKAIYILKDCPSNTSEKTIEQILSSVPHNGVSSPPVQDAAAICRLRSLSRGADDSKIQGILEKVRFDGAISRSVLEQKAIYRLNNLSPSKPISTILAIVDHHVEVYRNDGERAIHILQSLPPGVPRWILRKIRKIAKRNSDNEKKAREEEVIYLLKNCPFNTSERKIKQRMKSVTYDRALSRSVKDAAAICRFRSLRRGACEDRIEHVLEEMGYYGVVPPSILKQIAFYRLYSFSPERPDWKFLYILEDLEKYAINEK